MSATPSIIGAMKLSEMPTRELRRALHTTVLAIGSDSQESQALRRELARRRKGRALEAKITPKVGRRHD